PRTDRQVDSWLDFASSLSPEHLPSLNKHLNGRSFLAGGAFSLADVAVYFACASAVASAAPATAELDLARWFNQVQHRVRGMAPSCQEIPPAVTLNIFSPVTVPLPAKRPPPSAAPPAPAASGAGGTGGGGDGGEDKAKSPAEGAGGSEKQDKKKKKKGAA
ncbi:unnamed protein product, partial [Hapterophycus canaliculatus]